MEGWDRKQKCTGGPTGPSFFLLSFSPSSPAKPAIENSTSQIPVARGGHLRSSPTLLPHIETSLSWSCGRRRPRSSERISRRGCRPPLLLPEQGCAFLDHSTHYICLSSVSPASLSHSCLWACKARDPVLISSVSSGLGIMPGPGGLLGKSGWVGG